MPRDGPKLCPPPPPVSPVPHTLPRAHVQLQFAPEKRSVDERRRSEEMRRFWKERGPGARKSVDDERFDELLRAGADSMKRQHELTGVLAEQEAQERSGRRK